MTIIIFPHCYGRWWWLGVCLCTPPLLPNTIPPDALPRVTHTHSLLLILLVFKHCSSNVVVVWPRSNPPPPPSLHYPTTTSPSSEPPMLLFFLRFSFPNFFQLSDTGILLILLLLLLLFFLSSTSVCFQFFILVSHLNIKFLPIARVSK